MDSKSPDLSKHVSWGACHRSPWHHWGQGWDRRSDTVAPQDFLGQAFCTLGEIVGSAGSRLEKPLT